MRIDCNSPAALEGIQQILQVRPDLLVGAFGGANTLKVFAGPFPGVMLHLDPGEGRIRNTRSFCVWEGGGEHNVARGAKRCFGSDTAIVTALAYADGKIYQARNY